ncbi:MAG: hypothetical protein GC152_16005 [Alphaproteobacteria bacterium]|nr:hypothetical protein [Alphaproteobacteria bacterium]
MRRLLSVVMLFLGAAAAHAQECQPTAERHAARILGRDSAGGLTPNEFPFVAGEQSLFQTFENGWTFALMSTENGWAVRVFENPQIGMAVDLTSLTPPHGGAPNPRDIEGWHFRNADNTAPNDGSVNAPQSLRAFIVSPGLVGTGGYKPSPDPGAPRLIEPGPDDGIGWLKVLDYGLAGASLVPGGRARMNYLKFDACIAWPRGDAERDRLLDADRLEFTAADHETFGSCGLDLEAFALDATYLPRRLGGDLDGDGAADAVAQVVRKADGKRGLALCRAGTWTSMIGFDDMPGDVAPSYLDQVEAWTWVAPDAPPPPSVGNATLPVADGAILLLERIEKELVAVYWRDEALAARRLYHIVEP